MKKILYSIFAVVAMLSLGMLSSCSEESESFITAGEDDFPQILLPWFGEWVNGEPAVYKSITRSNEFVDSVVVTPALYTNVEWFIDDVKIHEGKKIQHTFIAGEYILKIVATTTKGKSTSRTGKLIVLPAEGDPSPNNSAIDRQVVPGTVAQMHGTNLDKIVKVNIGDRAIDATFYSNNGNGYLEYNVPADFELGTYKLTLTDKDGMVYGCGNITITDVAPVAETVLWEGSFNVTWGTPFNLLQTQFKDLVKSGDKVRAYVEGNGQGTMTTAWWNNILTGKGDPERDDIIISGAMTLEFVLTDFSMQLMNEQDGALFVGDGYTLTKVTKE